MFNSIKSFVGKYRKTVATVVGLLALAGIGIWVGDVTIGQVKDCVVSLDPASVACGLLDGTP